MKITNKGLKYRLALDMGQTSIGWCLLRLDASDQPYAIIRLGVRVFSSGLNPKDGSSLAVKRRTARQGRRRRDRLLKRKNRLKAALIRLNFFPNGEDARKQLLSLNPYQLRAYGLDNELSGPEFARALFHLNQRRGFLSNRKTDASLADSGPMKKAISVTQQAINASNSRTLGEWLYQRQQSGLSLRARLRGKKASDKAYDFYIERSMIEQEFDALWETQKTLNPALYHESARVELKDILLHQRPLKPVKPGRCSLIPEAERASRALPSTQRFRIFQEANNLRILYPGMKEVPLTLEQRNKVVQLLERGDVSFDKIKKALNLSSTLSFNLADIKRTKLSGNLTSKVLSKGSLFGKQWFQLDESFQDEIVTQLLNEPCERTLLNWLTKNTGVSEEKALAISQAKLPEGYVNLSHEAIQRLLPELQRAVITYDKAVTNAGFSSHSQLSYVEQTGEILQELPYYGKALERHTGFGSGDPQDTDEKRYGKIANPTVHIGLNELRKVVNALVKRYGPPAQVVIEMARALKLGKKRRMELEKEQKQHQDRNHRLVSEACEVLGMNPETLDKSKRRELSKKLQLWEELNPEDIADRRCPYTGEPISIGRLLSADVEIEHILPYCRTLDDSMNNKTVAMRHANKLKRHLTPFEAFGNDQYPGYQYNDILARVAHMPTKKKRRFGPDGYQWWLKEDQDFIARALTDTAYLSRIAKEYLSLICPPNQVWAIPGHLTALLRKTFGLNPLLSDGHHKNRDDHRHHALDAAVIGISDRALLQRFSKASRDAETLQTSKLVKNMPLPWPSFIDHVKRALAHLNISRRPEHGYQGAIHEETAWGLKANGETRCHEFNDHGERAAKPSRNKESLIWITDGNHTERHGLDEHGEPKPYKGYVGGSHHSLEIYRDEQGQWAYEVITTFQAYQVIKQLGETAGLRQLRNPKTTQSGKPLVMRLMKNDLVKLETDTGTGIYTVINFKRSGQIALASQYEANTDARDRDKQNPFKYLRKNVGPLAALKARKVTVSAIGTLNDPGFKEHIDTDA